MNTSSSPSALPPAGPGLDHARLCIDTVLERAAAQRVRVAVAVVDRGGRVVASARMDGVAHFNLDVAVRKAVAAQGFGVSTKQIGESAEAEPAMLHAFTALGDQLVVLPGGFPVTRGVVVVGGLGIAGGHHSMDHALGEAALAALAPG